MRYKAMYKSELAEAAGVSRMTLYRWLKAPEIRKLMRKEGIKDTCKLLPPHVVKGICERYVILS